MRTIIPLAILFGLASGCGGGGDIPTGDSASFAGRLEAAKAITNATNRDKSLAALAVEAAKAGEGDIAKQSVGSIVSGTVKDEAAYDAAVALARLGKTDDAKKVADLMISTTRKDKAMAKIAEGK